MIILLAALLIVGLLVYRQLTVSPSTPMETGIDTANTQHAINPPKIPTKPQDVQAFGQQMNKFIDNAASAREKQIDQAAQ